MKKIILLLLICCAFGFSASATCNLGWRATSVPFTTNFASGDPATLGIAASVTICPGQQVFIDICGGAACFGDNSCNTPYHAGFGYGILGNTASATPSSTTSGTFTAPSGTVLDYRRYYFTGAQPGTFYLYVYRGCYTDESGTGISVFGKLEVKVVNLSILPSLSGNTTVCSGSPINVTGTYTESTVTDYFWGIEPCDPSGNVTGAAIWTSWFHGATPGNFPYASVPPLTCNAYYKIKLAVATACAPWIENAIYVHVLCSPTPNAGLDQTICYGSCAGIGTDPGLGKYRAWNWTANGVSVGNTPQITVCPTQTTTYTLTQTQTNIGCSGSDNVTITVLNNNPDFILTGNPSEATYLKLTGTPLITTGTPPGFGFVWIIDELDGGGNLLQSINSGSVGSCWWTFPAAEVFDGLNALGTTFTPDATGCTPTVGQFKYNTTYRFTRGTWSDACPWVASSTPDIHWTKSADGDAPVTWEGNLKAHDLSYYMDSYPVRPEESDRVAVYPNPASDALSVEYTLNEKNTGELRLVDLTGRVLKVIKLSEGTTRAVIDLSDVIGGSYLVQVFESGSLKASEKVIVEK